MGEIGDNRVLWDGASSSPTQIIKSPPISFHHTVRMDEKVEEEEGMWIFLSYSRCQCQ
jgi:hypothetical protein